MGAGKEIQYSSKNTLTNAPEFCTEGYRARSDACPVARQKDGYAWLADWGPEARAKRDLKGTCSSCLT